MKWLLKNPSVCVFAVLALAKAAELQINAKELNSAYNFAFKYFKDCNEFINNEFRLNLVEAPVVQQGVMRNVLFWNSCQGHNSHAHVY